MTAEVPAETGAVWPVPWRVESREAGVGPGEGLGDSGVEGGAAPGGVWEVLAVAAQGRDTPEPPQGRVVWQPRVKVKRASSQQIDGTPVPTVNSF